MCITKHGVCSWFYQWYQWYTDIVQGSTNGTIGNTIGTNGNANGNIGAPNGTTGTIGKPMVPLATNGTIGKIPNGTIGKTSYVTYITTNVYHKTWRVFLVLPKVPMVYRYRSRFYQWYHLPMVPLVSQRYH